MNSRFNKGLALPSSKFENTSRFREKRTQVPSNLAASIAVINNGEKVDLKIIDISRFGARVVTDSLTNIRANDRYLLGNVFIKDRSIYNGELFVVNEFKTDSDEVSFGISFAGSGIDIEHIHAMLNLNENESHLVSTKSTIKLSDLVIPEFKVLVADLNTLFQDLKAKLILEQNRIIESTSDVNLISKLKVHAVDLALALYTSDIRNIFEKFENLTHSFEDEANTIHKRYFRANFHPTVLGAPFVNRSYNKPLGYAGDYGLMVMLYEPIDTAVDLFESFFHRFSCNEPAAVANKNRVEYLCDRLGMEYDLVSTKKKKSEFKVSSLACGPAKEVELFLRAKNFTEGASVRVICIDNEEAALDHAQQKLRPLAHPGNNSSAVFYKEDGILGIIKKKPFTQDMADSDVIVCAGLFDYLSDRVAVKLIESLYDLVVPGGKLIIGNVSTSCPDRFSMDYFAEWNLILRSSNDMLNLVSPALKAQAAHIKVNSESLGINLFLEILKPD